jgi:hypothetical protein
VSVTIFGPAVATSEEGAFAGVTIVIGFEYAPVPAPLTDLILISYDVAYASPEITLGKVEPDITVALSTPFNV